MLIGLNKNWDSGIMQTQAKSPKTPSEFKEKWGIYYECKFKMEDVGGTKTKLTRSCIHFEQRKVGCCNIHCCLPTHVILGSNNNKENITLKQELEQRYKGGESAPTQAWMS